MLKLASLLALGTVLVSGVAQAQPFYTTAVKNQIRQSLSLPAGATVTFSSTRMYHPPASERSRLYELRAGTYTASYGHGSTTRDFSFKVYRSGRVRIAQ